MNNNMNQNFNFSNNVKQFELNEAKKKMGLYQAQQLAAGQQLKQANNQNKQEFNTMF